MFMDLLVCVVKGLIIWWLVVMFVKLGDFNCVSEVWLVDC